MWFPVWGQKPDKHEEAIIYVEIDPTLADQNTRPDRTHIFTYRRPELYHAIADKPELVDLPPTAASLDVAIATLSPADPLDEIQRLVEEAVAELIDLVSFPEISGITARTEI